jgi:hypothetical protein
LARIVKRGMLAGQKLELAPGGSSHVLPIFVDDVDTTGEADVVLQRALLAPGMPREGEPHRSGNGMTARAFSCVPVGDTQVVVLVTYATPQGASGGGGSGNWRVRFGTGIENATTALLPGTWQQILVSFKNPLQANQVVWDCATVSYAKPVRVIEATCITVGPPSTKTLNAAGKVNRTTWQGMRAGFWRCDAVESEVEGIGSAGGVDTDELVHVTSARFTSRVTHDWSEYAFVRDDLGKFIRVQQAVASELMNRDYVHGVTVLAGSAITRVGPYETADFNNTFPGI